MPIEEHEIQYIRREKRGSGFLGENVYAVETDDGQYFALKEKKMTREAFIASAEFQLVEAQHRKDAEASHHDNGLILPLSFFVNKERDNRVDVVYPLMQGSLIDISDNTDNGELYKGIAMLSEADLRRFLIDSAEAIDNLHSLGFIHRDLKEEGNFLSDGHRFYLADFHLARKVEKGEDGYVERLHYAGLIKDVLLHFDLMREFAEMKLRGQNLSEISIYEEAALVRFYGSGVVELFNQFTEGKFTSFSEFIVQVLGQLDIQR